MSNEFKDIFIANGLDETTANQCVGVVNSQYFKDIPLEQLSIRLPKESDAKCIITSGEHSCVIGKDGIFHAEKGANSDANNISIDILKFENGEISKSDTLTMDTKENCKLISEKAALMELSANDETFKQELSNMRTTAYHEYQVQHTIDSISNFLEKQGYEEEKIKGISQITKTLVKEDILPEDLVVEIQITKDKSGIVIIKDNQAIQVEQDKIYSVQKNENNMNPDEAHIDAFDIKDGKLVKSAPLTTNNKEDCAKIASIAENMYNSDNNPEFTQQLTNICYVAKYQQLSDIEKQIYSNQERFEKLVNQSDEEKAQKFEKYNVQDNYVQVMIEAGIDRGNATQKSDLIQNGHTIGSVISDGNSLLIISSEGYFVAKENDKNQIILQEYKAENGVATPGPVVNMFNKYEEYSLADQLTAVSGSKMHYSDELKNQTFQLINKANEEKANQATNVTAMNMQNQAGR